MRLNGCGCRSVEVFTIAVLWAAAWNWLAPPAAAEPAAAEPAAAEPAAAEPAPPADAPAPGKDDAADADADVEQLDLETTDGIQLRAWYYPAKADTTRTQTATVILLHDLDGSHKSIAPLAKALQKAGCAVVAPDLRGHGESTTRQLSGREAAVDAKLLKKADFDYMTATSGGQVRDQSAHRGDIEAVRNWIKRRAADGDLSMDRLYVVGSGLGGAWAMAWTTNDSLWPDTAKGPQGKQVRGLVLISPTWTTRGFTISPALGSEPMKRGVPVMVIAGTNDRDSVKIFDHLKRLRPLSWWEQRADGKNAKAEKLTDPAKAAAFLFEFNSTRTADALASDRSLDPAAVIAKFFSLVNDRPKR